MSNETLQAELAAIRETLQSLTAHFAPDAAPVEATDVAAASAFVWRPELHRLEPVPRVALIDLDLLLGIERSRRTLLENTLRFAQGRPANNALLWGARGMGKSSLIKAVHAKIIEDGGLDRPLLLVELAREDIATVGRLLTHLAGLQANTLLFCDDLSFDYDDAAYKSLKTVLDGGLAGRPQNVLFYATSNRRHLLPRDMMENEQRAAIHSSEAIDEKVSLSDRFGLWLGFHRCDQDTFLAMVSGYIDHAGVSADADQIRAEAIEWAATRGGRSGRVAWQFAQDFIGRHQ